MVQMVITLFLFGLKFLYIWSLLIVDLVLTFATPFKPSLERFGFMLWLDLFSPSFLGGPGLDLTFPIVSRYFS